MFDLDFFEAARDYAGEFYYWAGATGPGRAVMVAAIVAGVLLARWLLVFMVCKIIDFRRSRLTYEQERIFRGVSTPFGFIPIVVGTYMILDFLKIPHNVVQYTRALLKTLFAFNLTWLAYSFVDPAASVVKRKDRDGTTAVVITWLARGVKFMIIMLGLSVILEHWNVKLSTILASVGVLSLAVALGAQDMVKNIIAGIAIITEKRFNVGDIVKAENASPPLEGIVENIGFRSTLIRKFDRALMFVPNNTMADAAVINFSSRLHRRVEWTIRLEYRTSSAQLRYIRQEIEAYMMANPDFVKPPEAMLQIRIDKFGDSSIDLLIYCFTNTNVWIDFLKIKEGLLLKIKEIVEEAGAKFAVPASSVYIEKMEGEMERPELPARLKSLLKSAAAKEGRREKGEGITFMKEEDV